MVELSSNNVEQVFTDCLFKEGEKTDDAVMVEGIVRNFGFNPTRIKEHEKDITDMLNDLPDQFHEEKGGGWSFLNACQNKDGEQWTGLHAVMEQLFVLGMAINKVKYVMPRDMWDIFPGSMPYLVVLK